MPACPNCGRQTLRTKDWACQWCGYPLLSKAYKKIDKTFRELQEERRSALKAVSPEPAINLDADLELDFKPEPALESKFAPEPAPVHEPAPEPELAVEPEPAPEPGPAPRPAPQLAPRPVPRPLPEPEPVVVAPDLDTLTDGSVLSVDELDALFKANRPGAHDKLTNMTIVVKGFVEKVFIRDHIDVRYAMLTGARKKVLWPVRCTFEKPSVTQMMRLKEGQEVAIRGRYDSYSKNIIFKDCTLVG